LKGSTKLWATLIVVVVALACFYGGYQAGYGAASAVKPAPTITAPQNATIPQVAVSRHEVKYPITIVDSAGKNVTIKKEPQRVVAVSTSLYVLLALGVGDKIVGVGEWVYRDPIYVRILQKQGARDLINLGPWPPTVEGILSANPDLVILYATFHKSTMDDIASKLPPSITVVRFDGYILDTMVDELYKLGLIFNRVERASELISKWDTRLFYIAAKAAEIKPSDKVRVFFETYTDLGTIGASKASLWHTLLTLAGGVNIFGDVTQTYPRVSAEAVVERNPDVIIKIVSTTLVPYNPCTSNSTKPLEDVYNTIVSRPGWDKISAVRNRRVYVYTNAYVGGGVGYVTQLAIMAKLLYPNVFKELDPQRWIYDWLRDMGLESPEQVCKLPWVYPGLPAG
jgi:iron complex transport system substrate-binding protein